MDNDMKTEFIFYMILSVVLLGIALIFDRFW